MRILAVAALAALPLAASGDEGMWTFDGFPAATVEQRYGFRPGPAWLDQVRLASARIAGGCSASFVSPAGLVLTNDHCALPCLEQRSTRKKDLARRGFLAARPEDELRCPDLEVQQLVRIGDVTAEVRRATEGLEGARHAAALRAEEARLEQECQTSPEVRCEVVSLYRGRLHALHTYRRFGDVRLVFAPEFDAAFFGGDPDNFMFPRHAFDVAFLRVYDRGAPARVESWFRWASAGAREGELVFASGHPGGTSRQLTVAQLELQRDVALPERLIAMSELRGALTEYQRRGAEQRRRAGELLFDLENGIKALRGEWEALRDPGFFRSKVAEEEALRAALARDPELARRTLPAFDAIARAQRDLAALRRPLRYIEQGGAFQGDLFQYARTLVRGAAEREKPSGERLREYRDAALPRVREALLAPAPVDPELEILQLGFGLRKLREALGPDHPFVRKVLGRDDPQELAERLVKGTRLGDPKVRRELWDGGGRAVEASRDPMIDLARRVDADGREVRRRYEDEVEAVVRRAEEAVAQARFEVQGTATYPDATFTLRLSYGQVKGWREDGREVPPFTTLGGAFERATGKDPFRLPESWLAARARLDLATPLNFASTADIVGGSSGSPVVNQDAELVGVVFDGNLHSLGGEYGFDPATNRAVAVDARAILHVLERVYRADALVRELRPERPARAGAAAGEGAAAGAGGAAGAPAAP
jgi:hypothetical protein